MAGLVQQAVSSNNVGPRVAQDSELSVSHFFPNIKSVQLVVNADGYQADIQLFPLSTVPR